MTQQHKNTIIPFMILPMENEIATIQIPIPIPQLQQQQQSMIGSFNNNNNETMQSTTTNTNNDKGDTRNSATTTTMQRPPPPPTTVWTYRGYSRAGVATSFYMVEPKWMFDCGCLISFTNPNPNTTTTTTPTPYNNNVPKIQRPTCIFITHTHLDHIQCLHLILFQQQYQYQQQQQTKQKQKQKNDTKNTIHVYYPALTEDVLHNYLISYYNMIRDDDSDVDYYDDKDGDNNNNNNNKNNGNITTIQNMERIYNFQLHPVQYNDEIILPSSSSNSKKNIRYIVRIVQCIHRKVCIGYSIFQQYSIYKDQQFNIMSNIELGQYLRTCIQSKGNIPTPEKIWCPHTIQSIFCFLGDTTTQVLLPPYHPELLQQHTIIAIECTYYYGIEVDNDNTDNNNIVNNYDYDNETNNNTNTTATTTTAKTVSNIHKHVYFHTLRTKILEYHPNILFLLHHFSNRHRIIEWQQYIYDYNQNSGHYNVHCMLPYPSSSLSHPSSSSILPTDSSVDNIEQQQQQQQQKQSSLLVESNDNKNRQDDNDVASSIRILSLSQTSLPLPSEQEQLVTPSSSSPTSTIVSCNCFLCVPSNRPKK